MDDKNGDKPADEAAAAASASSATASPAESSSLKSTVKTRASGRRSKVACVTPDPPPPPPAIAEEKQAHEEEVNGVEAAHVDNTSPTPAETAATTAMDTTEVSQTFQAVRDEIASGSSSNSCDATTTTADTSPAIMSAAITSSTVAETDDDVTDDITANDSSELAGSTVSDGDGDGLKDGATAAALANDPTLMLNGEEPSIRNFIFAAIGVMKNRKARPDTKRICNWIHRRYGNPIQTVSDGTLILTNLIF